MWYRRKLVIITHLEAMPTYFNVVTRPYCVDIIRLYLHHLVNVLQCSFRCQYYTLSVYFHRKFIALM